MSDAEFSDGIEELQDILAEYETKTDAAQEKPQVESKETAAQHGGWQNKSKISKFDEKEKKIEHPSGSNSAKLSLDVPMDKVVFGDKNGLLKNLAKSLGQEIDQQAVKTKKRKPAWTDANDEQIQVGHVKRKTVYTKSVKHLRQDKLYKEYLTARFTRIVSQPKWAALDQKPTDANSDDEDLLHTVGFLAKPNASALQSHELQYKRLKDLNRATYAEGSISSIQFHPTSTAALVAGVSGIATVYSIDGRKNEKLHSIRFSNFAIKCAKITPCGTKAIFGSVKRPFYYAYDLLSAQETRYSLPKHMNNFNNFQLSPCGRYMAVAGQFGTLHLFDVISHELIHTYKQEDTVAGIRFTADSSRIICNSESCNVGIFSLRKQRLEHTFIDDGCIKGRVLDISPDQRMLATGSMEGVVNVYNFEDVQTLRTPLPVKSFLNLTTSISDVKFNHSSEILAMTSDKVSSAVKLAHFPSGTVYANFPNFNSEIGKISTLEFSPASGYLALGNLAKEVPLIRLKHFLNY